jgi:broad specificity phosphatase PhoE
VLVVCHRGTINCLVNRLLGRAYKPGEPRILLARRLHWVRGCGERLWAGEVNALKLPGV